MKLKDFEDCISKMGLELISVTLSSRCGSTVNQALAVERVGTRRCRAYNWYFGCCRKSLKTLRYNDVRENYAMYMAKAPLQWSPFQPLNMTVLEKKYFENSGKRN